ncbi:MULTISPECIES: Z1 domain-containing protein [unclassified Stenotrophomonas]|uniref:Z1 domain-containing protein n=1 Tax=unclassified Stenotrophomonas TaxID=196198 RepID=UPI0021199021|nr:MULTISPECIES: Z1 domain-containing protein [unclassified Stenotrophomonas]
MKTQVDAFSDMIRAKLPSYDTLDNAVQALRQTLEVVMGVFPADVEANFQAATEAVRASFQKVEVLRKNSLIKPKPAWYTGPSEQDRHWPALLGYLREVKNWKDASESLDESSSEIVSLLANPADDSFQCRGLVVGYVQSGKTANMTAVIAKAVDAGYNLIILLGGVTNKLRAQTQRRIESDVVERHRTLWQMYTTTEDAGDFIKPANDQFVMPHKGGAQLVVMKKESTRLDKLLETVTRTPPPIMRKLKALIIDDECDQASVNAGADDEEMTRINEAIRRLIAALPCVSYVGYTATPFANVFINPFPDRADKLDDLYPEDFITALPRPKGYFGTLEVFGSSDTSADDDEVDFGRDMFRSIPPEELGKLTPKGKGAHKSFMPDVTLQLQKAIAWFLISCAIRRTRGQQNDHMTMLVHTSAYVAQHENMDKAIRAWISKNSDEIRSVSGAAGQLLRDVFAEEIVRSPLSADAPTDYLESSLKDALGEVLDALELVVENGESLERLDFTNGARTYIVVGGSVLARGLTLEGLCVSFFLRTSQQYDTLLQMGRWFGFRKGYEDLPRLWTTTDLISNFRALAQVEEEIRKEISVYRTAEVSPLDFAVKVRSIPGLAITSAAKMRHVIRTSISFDGKHEQTTRFNHKDSDVVLKNWQAASSLVDHLVSEGYQRVKPRVFAKVPMAVVRKFLVSYSMCDKQLNLNKELLLGYLDASAGRMPAWNVAIMSADGKAEPVSLGKIGDIVPFIRSRLREPSDYADIKALMSKHDVLEDVAGAKAKGSSSWDELKLLRADVPLLLVYPIDQLSAPMKATDRRVPLDARGPLIGLGFVFPGNRDKSGSYYSVELSVPTPDQLEDDASNEHEDADA